MSSIFDYYNKKIIPFGINGRRRKTTLSLLEGIKNKKVLDIGCASGYIGAVLKKQGNYVVGIDITKKDIAKAKKSLDKAYVFDIENDNTKILGRGYDLIVMIEVIEHLFDPEKAIAKFLPLLKSDGKVLISTPNFVQIYNRIKIFFGIFEYNEETVVNKSHIHFFTRPTFLKLISELGLDIIKEENVILPETFSFVLKFFPNLFSHQIIILAEKD